MPPASSAANDAPARRVSSAGSRVATGPRQPTATRADVTLLPRGVSSTATPTVGRSWKPNLRYAPTAPAGGAEPGLTLVLPGATAGRCAAFSVDVLSGAEQAFAGTALAVDDSEVLLRVDHWYHGGDADLVALTTSDQVDRGLVAGLTFTEGGQYLVSADSGVVTPCGYSAPWSEATARAYAEAFEG